MGVFGASSSDPYPTAVGTAQMPIGFRADEGPTETFPSVNPPSLKLDKADDRGKGITSNRPVDQAAALAAGHAMLNIPRPRIDADDEAWQDAHPVKDDATRTGRDLESVDVLAASQRYLNRRAGAVLEQELTAFRDTVRDGDRLAIIEAAGFINCRAKFGQVTQPLLAQVTTVIRDAAAPLDVKVYVICAAIRAALVAPCPAWCVVSEANHIADSGGFSPMHYGPATTIECHAYERGDHSSVTVRAARFDLDGVPNQAFVDLDDVSPVVELSPDNAVALTSAIQAAMQIVVADRAAVEAGV